jgi:hypothetical protein
VLDEIFFRLTLRTDGDVGLGTAWSEPLSFEQTGEQEVVLKMPFDNIEKGSFYVSIGFYRFNDLGESLMLDHITRAFKIEVEGTPVWNTNAHGFVRLPKVYKVRCK